LKVLVTRPEPGASATMAALTGLGFDPVPAPCLATETLPLKRAGAPAVLLLTSSQAIPGLPAEFRHLPCFCVGDATAARLEAAGFSKVESADGNAEDLARLVISRHRPGQHLLAVGEGHGQRLAARLRAAGIPVTRRTVYAARPVTALPRAARDALVKGEVAVALFYSAATARAFLRLEPPGTAGMAALALSKAVADALQGLPWRAIRVAVAPRETALLALLNGP
jgi:uroporphyrinogen-III synthase